MSKKRVILWALVAVAGMPLSILLLGVFNIRKVLRLWGVFLDMCWPPVLAIWIADPDNARMDTFIQTLRPNPSFFYAVLAFAALGYAVFRWFKKPRTPVLLLMLFSGWALCGLPGQVLVVLLQIGLLSDGQFGPYSGNTVRLRDGRQAMVMRGGSVLFLQADGSRVLVTPLGQARGYVSPSDSRLLPEPPDATLQVFAPDDPRYLLVPDGYCLRLLPEGTSVQQQDNGNRLLLLPNGQCLEIAPGAKRYQSRRDEECASAMRPAP